MKELEKVVEPLWYASSVYLLNSVESKFSFPNFLKFIKYKDKNIHILDNYKIEKFSIYQCWERSNKKWRKKMESLSVN